MDEVRRDLARRGALREDAVGTDLPGSDPAELYESLNQTLRNLPDDTVVYPGHNYADRPTSTIGEEKRRNMFIAAKHSDVLADPRGAVFISPIDSMNKRLLSELT